MVDRISAPEFVDDPRPRLNDIRGWPIIGLFGLGLATFGGGIWYFTAGDATPANRFSKDGSQTVANAAPLPGLPTDYTQIKIAPPPPSPEEKPPAAEKPAP